MIKHMQWACFFFEKTHHFFCNNVIIENFIRGTISHMTLVIFVVKLNISVSRISQIIFFFVAGLIILDFFLQIPVGY